MRAKVRLLELAMEAYADITKALWAFIASQVMKMIW
jgi:hypothetical protein